jgi:hypothetical protein
MDVAENVSRIAALLSSGNPNRSELKQRENMLKKSIGNFDVVDLLIHHSKSSLIELLLSLQLVERSIKSRGIKESSQGPLWDILIQMMASDSVSPQIRRYAVLIAALVCLKYTCPKNLFAFFRNQLRAVPETVCLSILSEIPIINHLTLDDKDLLQIWSAEVWPAITNRPDLMENWVPHTSATTIRQSSFLSTFDPSRAAQLEDVLVTMAHKPELAPDLLQLVVSLIDRGDLVRASRVFGEIRLPDISVSVEVRAVLMRFRTITHEQQLSLSDRLRITENLLGIFENEKIIDLNMQLFEVLVVLSAFPPAVPTICEEDLEDEESPDGLHRRFLEIRQEMRHIVRSLPVKDTEFLDQVISLVNRSLSLPDWRITESVLHLFSAMQKRVGERGGQVVCELIASRPVVDRNIANVLIICATTYFQSLPREALGRLLTFVMDSLANIGTLEPTGWYPFRSKQDNSSVVLLQAIAGGSRQAINEDFFQSLLFSRLPMIKERLYYRDPFRQTRNIFVKSVANIVLSSCSNPGVSLPALIPRLCDDCEDISTVLSEAEAYKQFILPLIEGKLENFLRENACGIESMIAVYSDTFTVDQIMASFELSLQSPRFSPENWLRVAAKISVNRGAEFVVRLSDHVSGWPMKVFPAEWFSSCLSLVRSGDHTDFHIHWIKRIINERLGDDQFRPATQYVLSALLNVGKLVFLMGPFVTRLIVSVSTINCGIAIEALTFLGKLAGWSNFSQILVSTLPRTPTEAALLAGTLEKGDHGKAKRIMKKIAPSLSP